MEKLYAVQWVEIEYGWGERPEGYKVFNDLEQCKKTTLYDSSNGNYESGGGYMGPVRPLFYYEFYDNDDMIKNKKFPTFVNYIKYKSKPIYINN